VCKFTVVINRALFCVIFVRERRIISIYGRLNAQSMKNNVQKFIKIWDRKRRVNCICK